MEKTECTSIGILKVCECKNPIRMGDNRFEGDQKLVLWLMPCGFFAIETNGDPIFEDQAAFEEALHQIAAAEKVI